MQRVSTLGGVVAELQGPLAAFIVAFLVLRGWLLAGAGRALLDRPNHRSLHGTPVPRSGGVAIMVGVLIGWFVQAGTIPWIMGLAGLLFLVSLLDDWRGLSILPRLMTHFSAALLMLWFSAPSNLHGMIFLTLVLTVVWAMNAYNFMDGADGLAGGMAVIGFGMYAMAAWQAGDSVFAAQCLSVAGAALAFLWFNRPPARIFMGDAGAIPLGFLAASMGILGVWQGYWPGWFPPLVFSPFLLDATLTLLKRIFRGEPFWQAHRQHYYQRYILMGRGHGRTAAMAYVLMIGVGASGLWARQQESGWPWVVLAWGLIYAGLMVHIDLSWARWRAEKA